MDADVAGILCQAPPTTMLVRSRISDASAVVMVNAVPFGPGSGGSVTVTNFPLMLSRRLFG